MAEALQVDVKLAIQQLLHAFLQWRGCASFRCPFTYHKTGARGLNAARRIDKRPPGIRQPRAFGVNAPTTSRALASAAIVKVQCCRHVCGWQSVCYLFTHCPSSPYRRQSRARQVHAMCSGEAAPNSLCCSCSTESHHHCGRQNSSLKS